MTKTDKKLISLTLIFAMLFTIFSPVIVNAAESVPEGAIEFKDQVLFEKLKTATVFDEELNKYVPVDKNEDGYITKQEMEDLESLTVYVYSNDEKITSLEDLAYAKNIKSLTVTGIDESVAEYDLTPFTKLESFNLTKSLNTYNLNYKMDKDSIKVNDDIFVFDNNNTGTSYIIYGNKIPANIELEVGNVYQDPILARAYGYVNDLLENVEMTIEDENIAKFTGMYEQDSYIQGLKEGTTTVTYKSDFTTRMSTIKVTKSPITPEQPLEETGVTARLVYDRILLSNGDLYKVSSQTKVEKEDTNVSDYVYIRDDSQKTALYLKLKNDNTLSITGCIKDQTTLKDKEEINKDVENVEQLLFDQYMDVTGFVTTNGEVYKATLNRDDTDITLTKIDSGVTKAGGAFYVKDGATYSIDGRLELNEEFDKAYRNTFAIGNKLYERRYNNGEYVATLVAEDFADYLDNNYWDNMYVYYKSTDGTVKDTYGYVDFTKYNFEYNAPLTNNFRLFINKEDTLCWGEVELLTDVSDVLVKVGTQEDLEASSGSYIIVVRKDGTVWTKDFYNYENFTKIFTPTEDDVELGNIDGDNEVTIKDVKLTLQYSLSKEDLSEVQIKAADVNKDGKVDIKDVRLILQYSLEKIDSFEGVE